MSTMPWPSRTRPTTRAPSSSRSGPSRGRRRVCLLAALLPVLSGCTLGKVIVEVFPDGSGKITYTGTEFSLEPAPRDDVGVRGARIAKVTDVRIKVREYEVDRLPDVDLGGIRFALKEEGGRLAMELSLPLAGNPPWFQGFGLDAAKEERAAALLKRMREEEPESARWLDPEKVLRADVVVKMPGKVLAARPVRPEALPSGWIQTNGPDSSKPNEVTVSIPLEEILRPRMEGLTLRIVSEKEPTEGVRKRWDRARAGKK